MPWNKYYDKKYITVLQKTCTHPNIFIKVVGGSCTVEELVDFCPTCKKMYNYRIDI